VVEKISKVVREALSFDLLSEVTYDHEFSNSFCDLDAYLIDRK